MANNTHDFDMEEEYEKGYTKELQRLLNLYVERLNCLLNNDENLLLVKKFNTGEESREELEPVYIKHFSQKINDILKELLVIKKIDLEN